MGKTSKNSKTMKKSKKNNKKENSKKPRKSRAELAQLTNNSVRFPTECCGETILTFQALKIHEAGLRHR
jgi:hypothetical protein